jgi:hypothetical protein
MNSFRTGSTATLWTAGTYALGAQVIYQNQVYESSKTSNTDTPPSATWRLIQTNYIGVFEQVAYNGQKIVLEYALNKWFKTTFRQPPSVSDIYITLNTLPIYPFIVGGNEQNSSSVFNNTSSEFVINAYSFTNNYRATINFPSAVYSALSSVVSARDKIVRAFVNQYIPAGITYQIVTY